MSELAADMVVGVWEAAREQQPLDRALTLLSLQTAAPRDELARLSLGERDRRLFMLRERLFGARMSLMASCPVCRESNDFEVSTSDLARAAAPLTKLRLPTTLDVLHALSTTDPRRALAECCAPDGAVLDDAAIQELAAALEAADPLAEIRLSLACAACAHEWQVLLDIGELVYSEIAAVAKRLLGEVHALAASYHWRESDILAMSAARRRHYLQMVGYE